MNDAYKRASVDYVLDAVRRSGLSATELARRIGLSPTTLTRPLNSETHSSAIGGRTLLKIAEFLGEELPLSLRGQKSKTSTSVISRVGAGAEIFPASEPFDQIDLTMDWPPDAFAMQVTGDSQSPKFEDGDILICAPVADPRQVLRQFAVLDLDDGRRLLKRLMPGRTPKLFTLLSVNASALEDARVIHAARIIYTKHAR